MGQLSCLTRNQMAGSYERLLKLGLGTKARRIIEDVGAEFYSCHLARRTSSPQRKPSPR
jgi:hypothetical protein